MKRSSSRVEPRSPSAFRTDLHATTRISVSRLSLNLAVMCKVRAAQAPLRKAGPRTHPLNAENPTVYRRVDFLGLRPLQPRLRSRAAADAVASLVRCIVEGCGVARRSCCPRPAEEGLAAARAPQDEFLLPAATLAVTRSPPATASACTRESASSTIARLPAESVTDARAAAASSETVILLSFAMMA